MNEGRNKELVDSFVESMKTSIRFYANKKLSETEITYLAEYTVNRLDFDNEWQMHKGIGYFARKAVERYEAFAQHNPDRGIESFHMENSPAECETGEKAEVQIVELYALLTGVESRKEIYEALTQTDTFHAVLDKNEAYLYEGYIANILEIADELKEKGIFLDEVKRITPENIQMINRAKRSVVFERQIMHMPMYQMKFMFDWGSGVCVWSVNEMAKKRFGSYPIFTSQLPISDELKIELEYLITWHDEALNWGTPNSDLLWNDTQVDDFLNMAKKAYYRLCDELGKDYILEFIEEM